MYEKKLFIPVQARHGAPETTLHIRIVTKDSSSNSLQKKPYIFMLPGGPGANHSHYKDYACLHTTANIVFIDPRGCGLSDRNNPTSYTMQNYIQDIDVIRQYLQLEKIILLGKSYGAICALGYTLDYPECVSSLILAAGSPSFHNLETARRNVEKRGTPAQKAVCEKLWAGIFTSDEDVDNFFNQMTGMYSWKARNHETTDRPEPDYMFSYEPLNQGFSSFLRHFDYRKRLSEVSCDTLILVGQEDWITSVEHSEYMAKHIPNSQLIVFPNADHAMEADVPKAFFGSIQHFLKQQYDKKQALNPVLSKQYNPVPMPWLLSGEKLLMIPINPEHQSVLHNEIYSQPSVMRYAGTGKSYTQEEFSQRASMYIQKNQYLQRDQNTGCLSLFTWTVLTQDGIAGRVNIFPKGNKTELAYCIAPKQQGRALARRASELVIEHLSEETMLVATVHPDNLASSKTLEAIRYPDGGFVFFRDPAKQNVPGVYGPNQPRDFFESKNQTGFTFFSFYRDRMISVDSSNTSETSMKKQ